MKRQSGLLAAAPSGTILPMAFLGALRRVDAVKTNALAVNLDGIAVDDGGDADDVIGSCECSDGRR